MTNHIRSLRKKSFCYLFLLTSFAYQLATAQTPLPDLTILSVRIQSATAGAITGTGANKRQAYDIRYTATVKNIGTAASARCILNAGFSKILTNYAFGGGCHNFSALAAGGTRTVTFTDRIYIPVPLTMPERDHRDPVRAYFRINDRCGDETQSGIRIEESNHDNNLFTTSVEAIKASH